MGGLIDLNVTEEQEEETTPSSGSGSLSPCDSSSSASAFGVSGSSSSSGVCLELWHACAGPLISLPKRGSLVLYFPQGHLEQAPDFSAAIYGLPPHVFCRILDVKLHVCLYKPLLVFLFIFVSFGGGEKKNLSFFFCESELRWFCRQRQLLMKFMLKSLCFLSLR